MPDKKRKISFKWLASLFFGGLLIEAYRFIFRKKNFKEAVSDLAGFIKEEEREIKELVKNEESPEEFCRDSVGLFVKYFVPHECNDHKPHFLRPRSLLVIALSLLFAKVALVAFLFLTIPGGAWMNVEIINRVLALSNQDRVQAGAGELAANAVLSAAAAAKAQDMLDNNYFAHYGPDGKKPWDWISRDEYPYLLVGENLAMNFMSADGVHAALMASPTHQKNIINPKYTEVGLAMASGFMNGKKTNVMVQMFAYRQEPAPVLALAQPDEGVDAPPAASSEAVAGIDSAPSELEPEEPASDSGQNAPETFREGATAPLPDTGSADQPAQDASPSSAVPVPTPVQESPVQETQPIANTDANGQLPTGEPDPDDRIIDIARDIATTAPLMARIEGENGISRQIDPESYAPGLDANIPPAAAERQPLAVAGMEPRSLPQKAAFAVNMLFVLALSLLVFALLINIFIRVRIQHRGVIMQTLALIIFVGGLIYFRLHFLEAGLTDILLL